MHLACQSIERWIFQADSGPSVSRGLYLPSTLSGCTVVRITQLICTSVKYFDLQEGKGVIETQRGGKCQTNCFEALQRKS